MDNRFEVHWVIIQFDNPIIEIAKRPLISLGFLCEGNLAQRHCPNKKLAEGHREDAITMMKAIHRNGRAFIITDKEFKMGVTKYNANLLVGKAEVIGGISGVSGQWQTYFPATAQQISESITF